MNRRPKLKLVAPNATAEEAAVVVAALEQFMRATAPTPVAPPPQPDRWQQIALREGVLRAPRTPPPWE